MNKKLIRKMLTASGGPLFPWLEQNTEWVNDWKFRTTPASRSRVLSGKGVETDKQYTERRKKEETKRTWRSDAADIAHGIGEGILAIHPYTAIPYFGAKVGQDVLNGNVSWLTALNASVPLFHLAPQAVGLREATNVALEDAANAGSKTARNLRVAREIKLATKNKPNIEVPKPIIRTKVGDVEIDNPELYYHQSDAGKAKNFVSTGRMRTPIEEYWLAKEETGEKIPLVLRSGIKPGYPQDPGSAMFSQGSLWYGLTPNKPDLLVTAREMPIANKNASIMSNKASLRKLEEQGTRRVTNDNIYTQGPHNRQNTTAYTWKPGYGYLKLVLKPGLTSLKFFERKPAKNNIVGASYDYRMEDSKGSMDFLKQFFALLKINGKEYTLEGLKDAKNVQQGLPEYIQSYLNLNTVERAVRAMRKNGYSEREILLYVDKVNEVMNKVKVGMYSDLEYNAAGALGFGGFYNNDLNFISVNKDAYLSKPNFTSNYILKHEGRHLIDYNTSMTDDVINILEKAYDKDFLEIPKHEDAGSLKGYLYMDRERVTTNRDARDVLLSNLEKHPEEFLNLTKFAQTSFGKNKDMVDFLNELILNAKSEDIINAVENSNGYGKRYINYLKKNNKLTSDKIEQLRLAMIHVPSYLLPITGGYTLYNLFNQPQLQYLKQGGKMNIINQFKSGGQIRKMLTASGGPIVKLPGKSQKEVDETNNYNRNKAKGLFKGIISGKVLPTMNNIGSMLGAAYSGWLDPETTNITGEAPNPGMRNPRQAINIVKKTPSIILSYKKVVPRFIKKVKEFNGANKILRTISAASKLISPTYTKTLAKSPELVDLIPLWGFKNFNTKLLQNFLKVWETEAAKGPYSLKGLLQYDNSPDKIGNLSKHFEEARKLQRGIDLGGRYGRLVSRKYQQMYDLITDPNLKHIADISPLYIPELFLLLKNFGGASEDFLKELIKRSNSYRRYMTKPGTAEDFKTFKGSGLIKGEGSQINVEGKMRSDFNGEYGSYPGYYEGLPNLKGDISTWWDQRIPLGVDVKLGIWTENPTIVKLRMKGHNYDPNSGSSAIELEFWKNYSAPKKFIDWPTHQVFFGTKGSQLLNFNVTTEMPKNFIFGKGYKQGGKMNILEFLKDGGQIRKMLTAAGGSIKRRIKRLKDGYRYIFDEQNGGWNRISDNEMSDVFATYIVKGKDKRADVRIDKKSENFDRKFKYDETEIPFIKDKEITLTNAGLYTGAKLSTNLLDSIAKYAKISGLPLKTAIGLVAKETSLGNPTVDSSLKKLTGDGFAYQLAKALKGGLHINEGKALNPKDLINFHYEELNPYLGLKNIAYKKSVGNIDDYGREGPFGDEDFLKRYRELLKLGENYSDNLAKKLLSNFNPNKNVLQAGFEFYKLNPRKYNYNQTNYPQLVEERGNMVYNSPEFKSWLSTSEYKKQGGKINVLEFLKNGSGIHIKEKNKGKFTSYCGGKVTDECILKGKNSSNPAIRKRATFADNARHFKHRLGGSIVETLGGGNIITAKLKAKSNLTKRKAPDWDNLDRGYRYLTLDMKLPHDLAIAIMGNVVEESQGDYKAALKNGRGRGLIQWDGRPTPKGRYGQWGSIWASVAKKANVYDPDTDTVKNYWAPWNGLKGDLVRLKFISAPLKLKVRIYAESYLRPGKPRIADRQLSAMQLDSIYNPNIKDTIVLKKVGGKIDFLSLGGGFSNILKNVGSWVLDNKSLVNGVGGALVSGIGLFKNSSASADFRDSDNKRIQEGYNAIVNDLGDGIDEEVNSLIAQMKEQNPDLNFGEIDYLMLRLKVEQLRRLKNMLKADMYKLYELEKQGKVLSSMEESNTSLLGGLLSKLGGIGTDVLNSKSASATKGTATGSTVGTTGTTTYVGTNGSLRLNNMLA